MGIVPYVEDDTVTARLHTLTRSHECRFEVRMNADRITFWRMKAIAHGLPSEFQKTRELWRSTTCTGFIVTELFGYNDVCETLDEAIEVLQLMFPLRLRTAMPFHMFSMRSPNASASQRGGYLKNAGV